MKDIDMRLLALLLLVGILILVAAPVWAGGGDHHNSGDVDVDVEFGGDTVNVGGDTISLQGGDMTGGPVNVSTGGNKSLALGNVLGDVDIAGCLGSTQWSTPVYGKQKLVVNWVCVAEFYIRYQQPGLAAMALCNTEILEEFDSEEECEQAHQFLAQAAIVESPIIDDYSDEEEFHEEQRTLNMALQSEIEQLRELYERRPTPKPVQHTVVEQKPLLTDDQKARLREVVQ